jgi:predicted Zn-dependent protease
MGYPSFPVVLNHSSLPGGRASATLTLTTSDAKITSEDASLSFPLRNLEIKRGGANNALVFLSHPSHPEWCVFTSDKTVLKALRESKNTEVSRQACALTRSRSYGWIALCLFLAVVIGAGVGIFMLRDPATRLLANMVPPSWERRLGEAVYAGIKRDSDIIEDQTLTKEFTDLLTPLLEVAKDSGYTFDVHISDSSDVNAFALPGGIIVVNKGAILKVDRLEMLLGVLAHEISHVTLQHSTRQVITVFGLYIVVDFVLGNIFGTIAAVSQGAAFLLQQGFSREAEHEADISGLLYLEKANINPQGMIDFFALLQKEYEESPIPGLDTLEGSLNFLSTHPDTNSRIQYLTERIKSQPPRGVFRALHEDGFKAFQTKLRSR